MNGIASSSFLGMWKRQQLLKSFLPTMNLKIRRNFVSHVLQPTKTLENTGSVARDLLAAERTFLAWARTGLGFVGAGSAMFAAYHQEPTNGIQTDVVMPSGVLVANGTFLLLFATRRYVNVCQMLQQNKFPLDTRGTFGAIVVTAVGTLTSLGFVLNKQFNQDMNPPVSDTTTPSTQKPK